MEQAGFSWGPGQAPPQELSSMSEELYKQAKENFVAGQSGGSLSEVMALMMVNASSAMFARVLFSFLNANEFMNVFKMTSTSRFVLEFALFVLPVLSAFTVAADQVLQIVMAQLLVAAFLHMLSLSLSGRPLISAEHHNSKARRLRVPRKPFITYYRACMLLATCVAILAVDFNIFPRRFAKSETFGTSLMDVGVGAFVFSAALVSPQARSMGHLQGTTWLAKLQSAARRVLKATKAVLPMLLLGAGRLVATRGANYQLHVTEYGVHWNFFFTMAGVSLASVLCECLVLLTAAALEPQPQGAQPRTSLSTVASNKKPAQRSRSRSRARQQAAQPSDSDSADLRIKAPAAGVTATSKPAANTSIPAIVYAALAIALVVGYQYSLSYLGWEDFIMHAPRTDVFSANREGFLGMIGFVSIYLSGLITGRLLAAVPPTEGSWWRTLGRMAARSAAAWLSLLLITGDWVSLVPAPLGPVQPFMSLPVSRRLANASYVLWVVAFNVTMLTLLLALDLLVMTYEQSEREDWVQPPSTPTTPQLRAAAAADGTAAAAADKSRRMDSDVFLRNDSLLLLALNKNGLAAFILASVVTGMVNMYSRTLFTPALPAFAIMCAYLGIVCGAMVVCFRYNIVLKFW